ncbi:MAG: hypothetical protein ABFD50_20600 [Smithella sp.]
MGVKTINPISPLLTGSAFAKTDTGGTTSSVIVAASTAQSSLDFSRMAIVIENYSTTAAAVVTLKAGDDYTEVGQGDAAAITVATGASVIIGGKSFESARFQNSDGQAEFAITTAATCYVYAVMFPFNKWN